MSNEFRDELLRNREKVEDLFQFEDAKVEFPDFPESRGPISGWKGYLRPCFQGHHQEPISQISLKDLCSEIDRSWNFFILEGDRPAERIEVKFCLFCSHGAQFLALSSPKLDSPETLKSYRI